MSLNHALYSYENNIHQPLSPLRASMPQGSDHLDIYHHQKLMLYTCPLIATVEA